MRPEERELEWKTKYGDGGLYGVYTGLRPTLTICDADLIKQVFIKDFHLYLNRQSLRPYHEVFILLIYLVKVTDHLNNTPIDLEPKFIFS